MSVANETPTERNNRGPDTDVTRDVSPDYYRDGADFDRASIREKLLKRQDDSGKYILHDKLAQGGMGTIFEVFDQDLRRTNVVKVIRPDIAQDPQMFRHFVDEARITAQLEHPNIVPVHDLGVLDADNLFFSMKMVAGEPLSLILNKLRKGDPAYTERYTSYRLLTIFRKICDAVAFAHSRDIIHRDLKPDNVMVAAYGEVLVMDWGLAKSIGESDAPTRTAENALGPAADPMEPTQTRYGVVKGTPAYMSPEQASGLADHIDKRSDVFLLGATLYAMATLRTPYVADDIYEMLDKATLCDFVPPAERAPERDIPEELCRIVMKAMALNPDERYQTVEELCVDVDAMMAGQTRSEHRHLAAGDLIIREGDLDSTAYAIVKGEVEVFKTIQEQTVTLVRLSAGDVVGEMAMISTAPRSASVVAVTDTEVVVITEETMQQGLRNMPPWMGRVVQALSDRLRDANTSMHPLMRSDCTYHVLRQFQLLYACHGRPVNDTAVPGAVRIAVEAGETINEIGTLLSLPRERVLLVLTKLLETGLIAACNEQMLFAPNLELFNAFVDFFRERSGIDASYTTQAAVTMLAAGDELVVRYTPLGRDVGALELEPVEQATAAEIIGCVGNDEILAVFEQFVGRLKETEQERGPGGAGRHAPHADAVPAEVDADAAPEADGA